MKTSTAKKAVPTVAVKTTAKVKVTKSAAKPTAVKEVAKKPPVAVAKVNTVNPITESVHAEIKRKLREEKEAKIKLREEKKALRLFEREKRLADRAVKKAALIVEREKRKAALTLEREKRNIEKLEKLISRNTDRIRRSGNREVRLERLLELQKAESDELVFEGERLQDAMADAIVAGEVAKATKDEPISVFSES